MSITILIKGKNTRIAKRFSIRKTVSLVVGVSLVFLVSSRTTESVYENQIRLNVVKTGLQEQVDLVDKLHNSTGEKLDRLIGLLAAMQFQLNQLDSISASLAKKNGLTEADFVLPQEINTQLSKDAELTSQIEKMADALEFKVQQLSALESILQGLNIEQESKLAGRPVSKGWLSSYYGIRKDPFNGKPTMHKGIDFAGEEGSEVVATGAGIVTWAGNRSGYGGLVEIDHGNGLRTRYGHNSVLTVKKGDIVTKGQAVALLGNTGRSTGAHVHYEVLENGRQIDPLPFIYR
ncbi:M23/M37 peptidase domain protein [Glaciecola punicea ACAM 611]|uniref:M23/M37 peptidase domain protein n=1 Tax=Glaciecola punicea ACAM 611 TaxID=1121923 RepID=H5TDM1_9ALTE|nr:M23 family metallopeptidase [Glaciecola punicea]GAB56398.1 M23/M37 peptidase domain protein [Glaciecola punicea ACAM 611]